MIMHGDTATSAGHPLAIGTFLPETGIEGTADPTIASRGSKTATDIMKPTQANEMSVGGMKKEVEIGISHLRMTNPADGTLGGNPGKITSSTGTELASSGEEKRT